MQDQMGTTALIRNLCSLPKSVLIRALVATESKAAEEYILARLAPKGSTDPGAILERFTRHDLANLVVASGALSASEIVELYRRHRAAQRPSMYIRRFDPSTMTTRLATIRSRLTRELERVNRSIREAPQGIPSNRNFELTGIERVPKQILEMGFEYEHRIDYTDPESGNRSYVYDLRPAWVWVDKRTGKVVINVHFWDALQVLGHVVGLSTGSPLQPLRLDRELMERIARLEDIQRGAFYTPQPRADEASSIVLGHEQLARVPQFRRYDRREDLERTHAFYRISIGRVESKGVGVSARAGKIWIPSYMDLEQLRVWTIEMLARLDTALEDLKRSKYKTWIRAQGLDASPLVKGMSKELKHALLAVIVDAIARAKIQGWRAVELEEELDPRVLGKRRYFLLGLEASCENCMTVVSPICPKCQSDLRAAPKVVNGTVEVSCDRCGWKYRPVRRKRLTCPSGHALEYGTIEELLVVIPTGECVRKTRELVSLVEGLSMDSTEFFWIEAGVLRVGVEVTRSVVGLEELAVLGRLTRREAIPASRINVLKHQVSQLNETCKPHPRDEECRYCLGSPEPLCLPKLVAWHTRGELHAHTGYEFGDTTFTTSIGGRANVLVVCPAKSDRTTLRLTNQKGRSLFTQVWSLLRDQRVQVVGVITGGALDSGLQADLTLLTQLCGKQTVFFDQDALAWLLNDYPYTW